MSGPFLILPVVLVAFALWSVADAVRAVAQAIEARRAETVQHGSVGDESAVGSADAPKGGSNVS